MNNKKVDSNTKFIIGSPEYNDYYFPKKDKRDSNTTKSDSKKVDPNTKFIIGSPEYNAYYFPKKDKRDPNTTKSDREGR